MTASFSEGLVGITLDGRYRLDAVLGEGGMGAVFRATHVAMDRKVAVKLLKPHLTTDEASLQRFAREARSTMRVDSPHAVKVLDYGVTPHRDYYMVLEYLDGRTVQRELDVDGAFTPARAVHVARQALHALAAAHATGLIHRDLKPENLLLMRSGDDPDYTKLLDFGVAKLMEGAARSAESRLALTQAGTVFGTPEFMSPEQACGQPLDGRSDLYSLAATMFVMLTGAGLYAAGSAIEWLTHHVRTPPPRLADARPELAAYPELDDVLQRCLAKRREHRPATAAELDAALARLEPGLIRRAAGASPSAPTKLAFSASTFFAALPAELGALDGGGNGDAAAPTAGRASQPHVDPRAPGSAASAPRTSTRDLLAAVQPPRRRLWLGLGAVVAAGGIAAAIAVRSGSGDATRPAAATGHDGRSTTNPRPSGSATAPAPTPAATGSGEGADPAPATGSATGSAAPAPDAGSTAGSAAGSSPPERPAPPPRDRATRPRPRSASAAAREHLRNAEDALRAGNHLRQMAEADLALRADPRNARATYLLGDALIKYGDLARGCAYLRALGRNPLAVSRAKAAGCAD